MRQLRRLDLAPDLQDELDQRARRIEDAEDPRAMSDRLWTGSGRVFDRLRDLLAEVGSGRQRCMYCEDGVGTDIDHFFPRRRYPLLTFSWRNHLLACADCNRRKNATFPLDADDRPVLIDPTVDDPVQHLAYAPTVGRFVELDERGAASVATYALNRAYLVQGRVDAWATLQRLIVAYAEHRRRGEDTDAEALRGIVRRFSFSSVLMAIFRAAEADATLVWLRPETVEALGDFPEIKEWLAD